MAVDDQLTKRFHRAIGKQEGLSEKKMMGGLCFMLGGNMLGGADRHAETGYGRFMFRVGKDSESKALSFSGTSVVEQGGRRMGGMIFVDADASTDENLKALAKLALAFVTALPPR